MKSMVLSLIQVHLVLEFKYTNGLTKIRIEIFQRSICIAIATKDYTRKKDGQRKLHLGSLHTTQKINLVEFGKIIIRVVKVR